MLKKADDVDILLKKRFQLKDLGYPNIYLTKDFSKEECENQWKLIEEVHKKGKDYHRIFQGCLVPREEQ